MVCFSSTREIVEMEMEVQLITHSSGGQCVGPCGTPLGGDHGPTDNPYGGGSDSSSSSEFGRKHRHD